MGDFGEVLAEVGVVFYGCEDVIEATNKWRTMRGEEPLSFTI